MKANRFFSEKEEKQISSTIADVEKQTAGEVAVMVVDQSDTYPEGRILAGILAGSLIALVITQQFFNESLWWFIPLAGIVAVGLGWAVRFIPPVFRFFVPVTRLETEVQERALRAFYEKGLYNTRDHTGVLFFLSLLEHRVWVLADSGIYSKISQETLQTYARDVAQGVKSGQACASLCQEIRRVGEILAEHFPIQPDDVNELRDEVIYDS